MRFTSADYIRTLFRVHEDDCGCFGCKVPGGSGDDDDAVSQLVAFARSEPVRFLATFLGGTPGDILVNYAQHPHNMNRALHDSACDLRIWYGAAAVLLPAVGGVISPALLFVLVPMGALAAVVADLLGNACDGRGLDGTLIGDAGRAAAALTGIHLSKAQSKALTSVAKAAKEEANVAVTKTSSSTMAPKEKVERAVLACTTDDAHRQGLDATDLERAVLLVRPLHGHSWTVNHTNSFLARWRGAGRPMGFWQVASLLAQDFGIPAAMFEEYRLQSLGQPNPALHLVNVHVSPIDSPIRKGIGAGSRAVNTGDTAVKSDAAPSSGVMPKWVKVAGGVALVGLGGLVVYKVAT